MIRLLMWPVWWLGVILAIATGAVWGFIPTATSWFDPVSLDDHLVSAGGYTAAAVVLLLAATALEGFDGPRSARHFAVLFAAIYTFMALRAGIVLSDSSVGLADGWDALMRGAAGPVMTPWSWFFIGTGVWGFARLLLDDRPGSATAAATA